MNIREFSLEFSGVKINFRPIFYLQGEMSGCQRVPSQRRRRARASEKSRRSPVRRTNFWVTVTEKMADHGQGSGVELDENDDAGDDDHHLTRRRE